MHLTNSYPGDYVLKSCRYDYFLIWGHGLKYTEEIVTMIRNTPGFKIITKCSYKPKSISRFVRSVYSYDYAPFRHLRAKTRYLLNTTPEVLIIFIHNSIARQHLKGEGRFRHIECTSIKHLKERIRDKFNERKNDRRTENHVIHASDNEMQVDHMLKLLGYREGVDIFNSLQTSILSVPYHIKYPDRFIIRHINISQIRCTIVHLSGKTQIKKRVPIEQTPHFKALAGDESAYKSYQNQMWEIKNRSDDHYLESLYSDFNTFSYLQRPYTTSYILVRSAENGIYIIIDGVHRAAKLKLHGADSLLVAEIL